MTAGVHLLLMIAQLNDPDKNEQVKRFFDDVLMFLSEQYSYLLIIITVASIVVIPYLLAKIFIDESQN